MEEEDTNDSFVVDNDYVSYSDDIEDSEREEFGYCQKGVKGKKNYESLRNRKNREKERKSTRRKENDIEKSKSKKEDDYWSSNYRKYKYNRIKRKFS